uniref:Uncharacterized protein n=1 Tax=Timema cristinae TaxID=61476 RepID=A0A7R9D4Q9_TIMCR|nr:unnamed protein product [Timema cristinae]
MEKILKRKDTINHSEEYEEIFKQSGTVKSVGDDVPVRYVEAPDLERPEISSVSYRLGAGGENRGSHCKPSVTRSLVPPESCVYKGVRAYPSSFYKNKIVQVRALKIEIADSERNKQHTASYYLFGLNTYALKSCQADQTMYVYGNSQFTVQVHMSHLLAADVT